MTNPLCIYHADCADGLLAAWAVHRALGPEVEFHAAKYGDLPPGLVAPGFAEDQRRRGKVVNEEFYAGRDVLIVDFSYPLATLRAMAAEARSVLVLDHHKTAQEDLAALLTARESFGSNWKAWLRMADSPKQHPLLAAIFDMERSGAGIVWDYLHQGVPRPSGQPYARLPGEDVNKPQPDPIRYGPSPRPRIIDLVEDRDLWRFKYGDESRAFHAVLTSYDMSNLPAMFERLDEWSYAEGFTSVHMTSTAEAYKAEPWLSVLAEGRAILRAQAQAVRVAVAGTRRTMRIAGHVVPVANVPHSMSSEAGHLMCSWTGKDIEPFTDCLAQDVKHADFVATYYDGADGRRHFSLRSPEGGADVGKIAKQMAEKMNEQDAKFARMGEGWPKTTYVGGGHEHAAGFDAPLGWEGE